MIRAGIIGLGPRGQDLLEQVLLPRQEVEIVSICDNYPPRLDQGTKLIESKGRPKPEAYVNFRALLEAGDIDCVFIFSSWENHIPAALAAMWSGIPAAVEVGGAYSVRQCWQLVEAYEDTGTPVMMLENCCYGRVELMLRNMVDQGLFGQLVHLEGGYHHDLRDEVAFGRENHHYRRRNYLKRNAENYPSHELGPIARLLHINRGNRLLSLVSVSSDAFGLLDYMEREKADDSLLKQRGNFRQGDVVTTLLTCAGGQTIKLTLDTTLPRPYSRGLVVQGTRGIYQESNQSVFLDERNSGDHFTWDEHWGNVSEFYEDYEHPIWQDYLSAGVRGGHDGMDWLVFDAFLEALESGAPMPIDVYDMATWMSVTALSEASLATRQTVAVPDFTNGEWLLRRD